MKISASKISKGLTIKVSAISDYKELYKRIVECPRRFEWEKKMYNEMLEKGYTKDVEFGSIKKNSPTLVVNDVCDDYNYTYRTGNGRKVTITWIVLDTDKGFITLSTRQKVEVI